MCMCETVRDAGENVGELWELAAALGRTEGVVWIDGIFWTGFKIWRAGSLSQSESLKKAGAESRWRRIDW